MELINSQIDKIEDLLSKMDEVIDNARSVPFSAKVSIEKDALFSVIDDIRGTVYEMRKGLPSEINQARRVLHDRDSHLSEARKEAERLIKAAESEANKILNEHDLTVQAKQLAAQIEEDARKNSTQSIASAAAYIVDMFDEADEKMQNLLKEQLHKSQDIENFYSSILVDIHDSRASIRAQVNR
jgi:chromosome segregation ATPase